MKLESLRTVSKWLVLIGALNWGFIGLLNFNLVEQLLGSYPSLVTLVYLLVGAAGLWGLYARLTQKK